MSEYISNSPPISENSSGVIHEGFLCPICFSDLGDVFNLQSHFEERHADDKDFIQSFKDVMSKAKRAIIENTDGTNREGGAFDTKSAVNRKLTYDCMSSIPLAVNRKLTYDCMSSIPLAVNRKLTYDCMSSIPLGVYRAHTKIFKMARANKYDGYFNECNKLLVKLDLLVNNEKFENITDRKEYEKSVVEWVPDDLVSACPFCHGAFRAGHRRKHHCRLCGAILCGANSCSRFLSFGAAKSLLNKTVVVVSPPLNETADDNTQKSAVLETAVSDSDNSCFSAPHSSSYTSQTYQNQKQQQLFLGSPVMGVESQINYNSHPRHSQDNISCSDSLTSYQLIQSPGSTISQKSSTTTALSSILSSVIGGGTNRRKRAYKQSQQQLLMTRICPDCDAIIQKQLTGAFRRPTPNSVTHADLGKSGDCPNIVFEPEDNAIGPRILFVYQKLIGSIKEAKQKIPSYNARLHTLKTYQKPFEYYEQTLEMYKNILLAGERIDKYSRLLSEIIHVSLKDPTSPAVTSSLPVKTYVQLIKCIRLMATKFLRENFIGTLNAPPRPGTLTFVSADTINTLPQSIDYSSEKNNDNNANMYKTNSKKNKFNIETSKNTDLSTLHADIFSLKGGTDITVKPDLSKLLSTESNNPFTDHQYILPNLNTTAISNKISKSNDRNQQKNTAKQSQINDGESPEHNKNPFPLNDDVSDTSIENNDKSLTQNDSFTAKKLSTVSTSENGSQIPSNITSPYNIKTDDYSNIEEIQALNEQIDQLNQTLKRLIVSTDKIEDVHIVETNLRELRDRLQNLLFAQKI